MGERLKINQNNQTSNQSNKKSDNENITRAFSANVIIKGRENFNIKNK